MLGSRLREVSLRDVVPGGLFLCEMPGRCADLSEYEHEMEAKGVTRVLCLAPLDEVREKSPQYAAKLEEGRFFLPVDCFPIPDYGTRPEHEMVRLAKEVAELLRMGDRILIHCGAGVGRTGTVAIAVLMALGLPFHEAEARVRQAGSNPETCEQKKLLRDISSALP